MSGSSIIREGLTAGLHRVALEKIGELSRDVELLILVFPRGCTGQDSQQSNKWDCRQDKNIFIITIAVGILATGNN